MKALSSSGLVSKVTKRKNTKANVSKTNQNEMKGISRIDSKGTHGWYVRVYKNGKTYSKLYSDNKYNGKERALKFAKKAREMALETIKSLPDKPVRRLVTSDKRNKSGVVGVSKTRKKAASGEYTEYYQVTWSPKPGKIKNRQWSVRKYGEDGAFERAKAFREEVMRAIYGKRYEEHLEEQAKTETAASEKDSQKGGAEPIAETFQNKAS
ncbi:MAG: hypothetical protein LAT67_07930 [Balneolales bacterium]|nr:hypothetical protein [Balneolales bacterium]